MKKSKFGNPIIFLAPIWVDHPEDTEVKFKLKPLTYKDIKLYEYYSYSNTFNDTTTEDILERSIIDTIGVNNFPNNKLLVKQLPNKIKEYLVSQLFDISTLTTKQTSNLEENISIVLDKKLQGDTWNCDNCKHRGLQTHRACPFIEKEKRQSFSMKIGSTKYTTCPIGQLDNYVLHLASESYRLMNLNILPENGNLGEQTVWFVTAGAMYKRLLDKYEKEAIAQT